MERIDLWKGIKTDGSDAKIYYNALEDGKNRPVERD